MSSSKSSATNISDDGFIKILSFSELDDILKKQDEYGGAKSSYKIIMIYEFLKVSYLIILMLYLLKLEMKLQF